jgi:hypothetical protein
VTICAAALCRMRGLDGAEEDMVIGISDRMLTSGDIEYEAAQSKIYPLGGIKALCLPAGDVAFHLPISIETSKTATQGQVVDIGDVARLYAENYASVRRARAERLYLAPHGLDIATFLANQRRMNESLVLSLADRVDREDLGVDTIIVGADEHGPHIYRVSDPGVETCYDGIGFCAVGSGARQFEAQLMYHGYVGWWSWHAALLLLYSAKRRAEVSPGVGRQTDVFCVRKAGWSFFPPATHEALDAYYDDMEKATQAKRNEILQQMVRDPRLVGKPAAQEIQTAALSGEASPTAPSQGDTPQEDVQVISPETG